MVSSVTTGTVTSTGVGSGLDVSSIVSQLMTVESQPLTRLQTKEASYNATLTAFGSLNSALSTFQTAVAGLSDISKFQGISATSSDSAVLSATATSKAVAGSYGITVNQIAQPQSIATAGQSSISASIGLGAATTTLSFQFGTIEGGTYGSAAVAGSKLSNAVAASGIAANSLSINGSTIVTDSSTTSAQALAAAINLKTGTTGVTATAQATDTGALGTGSTTFATTTVDGYSLSIGGVSILSGATAGVDAAGIDAAIATASSDLTTAGISVTGTAAAGTLHFTKANGANISVSETLAAGDSGGFFHTANATTTQTFTSAVSLSSSSNITVGGSSSATAGLTAGITPSGIYVGASFSQDAAQSTGTVTIGSSNNSLQGIRDAVNAAKIGITATIVSDSSSSPYHLVFTSNKTGETSSMKITASGDSALTQLLSYDPTNASGQKMTQTTTAQNAKLTVNGIAVSSASNSIAETIQGVSLNVSKAGSTTLTVGKDSSAVETNVNAFVTAYNTISKTLSTITAYNITTKASGSLQGDSTVSAVKNAIRSMVGTTLKGVSGELSSLAQIGVSLQKDGSLSVDSTKLKKAVANNYSDIASLFATVGTTSDSLITYAGATSETTVGGKDINITQLASQGKLSGSAVAGLTITAGVNDSLSITVDGTVANVTLAAGTYTASTLAAQVQSTVNGSNALKNANIGISVIAGDDGILTLKSNQYGSESSINASQSAAVTLFGSTPTKTAGTDVAGTIGGVAASGSGQFLTAATGSGIKGLKIQVAGGALGARGTVNYSQGYAFQFTKLVDNYIGNQGIITSRITGLNNTIKSLQSQEKGWSTRLTSIQARYQKQFSALDSAIGKMKTTSTYLTQQLDLISAQSKSNA
ncbi:MAG: flagellar filament capping protein FliD [Pseudomonadota bacterium]